MQHSEPDGASAPPPPASPPAPAKPTNGLGVTSVVLGSVALLGALIPFVNWLAAGLAVVAIAFGVGGLLWRGRPTGVAAAGTAISAGAFILSVALVITYASTIQVSVDDGTASAGPTRPVTVTYTVDGTVKRAQIIYSDAKGGPAVAIEAKLPWTTTITADANGETPEFSVVASRGIGVIGGTLGCTLSIDGKVMATKVSKGLLGSAADCSSDVNGDG